MFARKGAFLLPLPRDASLPPGPPYPACPRPGCRGLLERLGPVLGHYTLDCVQCAHSAYEWAPGCASWRVYKPGVPLALAPYAPSPATPPVDVACSSPHLPGGGAFPPCVHCGGKVWSITGDGMHARCHGCRYGLLCWDEGILEAWDTQRWAMTRLPWPKKDAA